MRVLIALNAFKGTISAAAASRAVALGVKNKFPSAAVEVLPIADGGDGLLEALAPVFGGRFVHTRVRGPYGTALRARWLLAGRTAVIEMAEAAGLKRAGGRRLLPLDASTFGVGQLMLAAARAGAREIVIGLGGSASNDGGAGCAAAFGFELLGAAGRPVAPGTHGLAALRAIRPGTAPARLAGIRVRALADVSNPLCGLLGSARVFAPQKGAGPAAVRFIGTALRNYARLLRRDLGVNVAGLKGGAAAGGLGAGLAAFFGAELLDGASFVLEKTGFGEKLRSADILITGEGCFDRQTFFGKAPGAAIARARAAGRPVVVVCGRSLITDRRALARRGVAAVIEAGGLGRNAAALKLAVERELPGLLAGIYQAPSKKV
ncbi:MAG: glycerate kinase [Elusimicrobia bacterium]|nr:glycerate kinase [Elusimicrobiota bacterium]